MKNSKVIVAALAACMVLFAGCNLPVDHAFCLPDLHEIQKTIVSKVTSGIVAQDSMEVNGIIGGTLRSFLTRNGQCNFADGLTCGMMAGSKAA